MKKLMIILVAAVSLAGCCTQPCDGIKDSGTTYMADALAPYVEKGELPGAVSMLYKDGVTEVACVGYADVAAKRKITADDVYMQCSQTKGFCGVTVAILVEEGKLSLDDPVSKYLPEFETLWVKSPVSNGVYSVRKAKNALTVRMVLNHTGGFEFELPNYRAMGGWSRRMPLRSVAATAAALPLKFEPGTGVQYSNVGIDIGAAVVEKVSGMRWENFLKERVFDPLGMKETGFWPTDAQLANKIELYDVKKGEKAKWREQSLSMQRPYSDDRVFPSAGAGLWTTVNDQYKFYKMLMNLGVGDNGARILKEETVKSILAVSTRPKGLGGYSLGLSAPEVDNEDQWFGHGGAWGTNCSVNWHKKQLKLWSVQLCGGPRPWDKAREEASEKFFKSAVDSSGVDAYTGRMK
jgi:CubicO group peptidase (beta-lactamase class C family)